VASLEGSDRGRDGALVLVALVAIAAAAAVLTSRLARREPAGDEPARRWLRHARPVAAAAVAAVACGLVVGGLGEKPSADELAAGAEFQRLTTVSSNRYEYWRVGLAAFEDAPLAGVGAGGFRVEWLRERVLREAVRDAHSIEVELAAELGVVGLLAFAVLVAGVAMAARVALRADPGLATGWCAALVVWFLHASIDWDFQVPAVTLPALALAAALIALSEERSADPAGGGLRALAGPWRGRARAWPRRARPRP
jgi:O-antigen ligase